jgi:phage tail P2-like protein
MSSLLPNNIDKEFQILESISNSRFGDIIANFEELTLDPFLCTPEVLENLIYALDIKEEAQNLSEDKKRKLVQNARELKRFVGTAFAVKASIGAVCGGMAFVKEWTEFGGKPFTFKVELELKAGDVLDRKLTKSIESTIDRYKNERSHLLSIDIAQQKRTSTLFVNAGFVTMNKQILDGNYK